MSSADIIGKKFQKLTVISVVEHKDLINKTILLCQCDCGNYKQLTRFRLIYGKTKSCGCAAFGRFTAKSIGEKFWAKVDKNSSGGCWEFKTKLTTGYGQIEHRGKVSLAHRVSWEIHVGKIPEGMFVCHRCDNPPCVNPEHLFLGSHSDNMKDMYSKGRGRKYKRNNKDTCKNGHYRTADNLYIRPDNGLADCVKCRQMAAKKQDEKRKQIRRENKNVRK